MPLSEMHLAALRTIAKEPENILERLKYADWLDDHDRTRECPACKGEGSVPEQEPGTDGVWRRVPCVCQVCKGSRCVPNGFALRAEFIRVQIALSQVPCPAFMVSCYEYGDVCRCSTPESDALRRREQELWGHKAVWDWHSDTRDLVYPGGIADGAWFRRHQRGFVERVDVSLKVFLGNRCKECNVSRGVKRYPTKEGNWTEDTCNVCKGIGYVNGLAPRLFRHNPITRVTFTDVRPDMAYWLWRDSDDGSYEYNFAYIPPILFDPIRESSPDIAGASSQSLRFTHIKQVEDVLSNAACHLGRQWAEICNE